MRAMTNIEYAEIVKELQPLTGSRFDRMYKIPQGYRLKIGSAQILIQPGIRLHKTKYMEDTEPSDQFVQKVRAELDNSVLESVLQVNQDRIIEFRFSRGSLVFEMFAKGNCIFVRKGKTIVAMREESWADREIKRGAEYQPPKSSISTSFRNAISEKYVIVSLLKLPLGKQYAQEILSRCRIQEKTPGTGLTGNQIDCIEREIEQMNQVRPILFLESGKPVDFGLVPFSNYSGLEISEPETFSEALDQFYWLNKEEGIPGFEKLERRLSDQEKRLEELGKEEAEQKNIGDYIYENFDVVDEILAKARSAPLDELEGLLSRHKAKVDKKEKSMILDL